VTERRRVGLFSASSLVVANMIGAGVFTTSGFALADLGDRRWVLLAWVVGGVLATCGALTYGALARRIPESGGEYTFLSATFHPALGFAAGWISLLAGFTAPIAAAALGLAAYLTHALGAEVNGRAIASAVVVVAGVMHGVRLKGGVWLQNGAVVVKLVAIAAFVVVGVALLPPAETTASSPAPFDLSAFAVSLVWISFSYSGWNAAVYIAGEVRDPDRNLARSLIFGATAVWLVYLALNAVFVFAAPSAVLVGKPEVGALAADALGGATLGRALSAVVTLSLFTSVSAMIMAGPRVYARMARDGALPRVFARGDDVPAAAIALQVGAALVVVWIAELRELLGYIGFTLSASAAVTAMGLVKLRAREGAARVPAFGYPFVPAVFIVVTLGTLVFMFARQPAESALGLLTIASGLPVYLLTRR
jgi:APA family basic amino acid/polyamine antiporter